MKDNKMKLIIITGNAGNDPEIFTDKNGVEFAALQVAVKVGSKNEWVYITCYGKELDFAKKYIKKGDKIMVRGEPSVALHINNAGESKVNQRILVERMELLAVKPPEFNRFDEYDYE